MIFCQTFGRGFGQIFGQVFGQILGARKYSVQFYWGGEIQYITRIEKTDYLQKLCLRSRTQKYKTLF